MNAATLEGMLQLIDNPTAGKRISDPCPGRRLAAANAIEGSKI